MMLAYLCVWVDALASLVIFAAVLRLYEIHHANMRIWARVFMASIALAALASTAEIMAWSRRVPFGMTAFLMLMAAGWALRAFFPDIAKHILPPSALNQVPRAMVSESPRYSLRDRHPTAA